MKKAALIFLSTLFLLSCDKEAETVYVCDLQSVDMFEPVPSTIIPLHKNNTWLYVDSIFSIDSTDFIVDSTEIGISRIYEIEGNTLFYFSSMLPSMSIVEDTLYSTSYLPTANGENGSCLRKEFPMFFQTTDSVLVSDLSVESYVYSDVDTVYTPAGDFANNMVYSSGQVFEIITQPGIGIIKISIFLINEQEQVKRRTLTLMEYELN